MKNWKKYISLAFSGVKIVFADGPHEVHAAKELLLAALKQNVTYFEYETEILSCLEKALKENNATKESRTARIRETKCKIRSLNSYFEFDRSAMIKQ